MRSVSTVLHLLFVPLSFNLCNHLHPKTKAKTFPYDSSFETRPEIMTMVKYRFILAGILITLGGVRRKCVQVVNDCFTAITTVSFVSLSSLLLFQHLCCWTSEWGKDMYMVKVVVECEDKQ